MSDDVFQAATEADPPEPTHRSTHRPTHCHEVRVTTSDETSDLAYPVIRRLVNEANALPLVDRIALLKGLIPGIARELAPREFEALAIELRLKGERFYDATAHPGEGRRTRHVIGERDFEGR